MFETSGFPIVQAPMLGAGAEALAIAVSRAGGLGSFPAAGSTPGQLLESARAIRAATPAPFAINLFILDPCKPDPQVVRAAIARLAPWRARYGLPAQSEPPIWAQDFAAQFEALLEAAPPFASFTFGCLTAEQASALHERGSRIIGTATCVEEALAWQAAGADAICAQGIEAGGHRGSFLAQHEDLGTLALVRAIKSACALPVIAAGGLMDGQAIAKALAYGADAVQIGTAFLLADEAATSAPWRAAIARAGPDSTRMTRVFSGRRARGIENAFMIEMNEHERDIPAYPVQNALTQDLRAAAARAGKSDCLSLWAGAGVALARPGAAGDIARALWSDAQKLTQD
jgi:nitronate monooxygenase